MYVEKETEKALLLVHDSVTFWVQKRWLKSDWSLSKEGWKSFHMASREHWKHFGFDALEEFKLVRETEKAALLQCDVEHPDGRVTMQEFWLPKSMTGNWGFVADKLREIEKGFPFVGTRVRWSGAENRNLPRGGRGPASSGGFPPSSPESPGDFI